MRNTVTVRDIDVTPVLHAIERARLRIVNFPKVRTDDDIAKLGRAAIEELGNIVKAADAYEAQASRAVPPITEPEEFCTVRGTPVAEVCR